MQTDELIHILSRAPQPRAPMAIVTALCVLSIAGLAVTLTVLGMRTDIYDTAAHITASHKAILLFAVLWVCAFALRDSAAPLSGLSAASQCDKKTCYGPARSFKICLPLVCGLFAGSIGVEWMIASPQAILAPFGTQNFPACLLAVSLYGTIGTIFLSWLMRSFAPADGKRAAMLIGAAAASAGALGYSIHCTVDSPTFIAVAYGIPVAAMALCARMVVPRFIRW